jgi:O-methyltransferase involved in polyketide biosynthesis
MVEVKVTKTRNGVYIYFPADYIRQLFNNTVPEFIMLLCGGRTVQARFSMMTSSVIRYRVYDKYVPALLEHDDCHLVVEQKV